MIRHQYNGIRDGISKRVFSTKLKYGQRYMQSKPGRKTSTGGKYLRCLLGEHHYRTRSSTREQGNLKQVLLPRFGADTKAFASFYRMIIPKFQQMLVEELT